MSSSPGLCVDASVVVRFIQKKPSAEVSALWGGWIDARLPLHAPTLIHYEVTNALRQASKAGGLTSGAFRQAIRVACQLPIELYGDEALHLRASELAADHGLPATYDAHYLALAERLDVEFVTADAKLAQAVEGKFRVQLMA
jgi:predicted nucleic acid-binding protein